MKRNKLGLIGAGLTALASVVGCGQGRIEKFGNEIYEINQHGEIGRVLVDGEERFRRQNSELNIIDMACYVPIAGQLLLPVAALIDSVDRELDPVQSYLAKEGQFYWEVKYLSHGGKLNR